MPQWSRDRSETSRKHPDERWLGSCETAESALLQRYDHHVVWIEGRRALLRTAPSANESQPDPSRYRFFVSFAYAAGHPPAPREAQAIVERIPWSSE
jgi:hypothetical protein